MEVSVNFPAGVTTLLSRAAKITNWRDSNLVRWDDGATLRPVGGWEQVPYPTTFASKVRRMHRWVSNEDIIYTAFLCESHVYIDSGGSLDDITPVGGMSVLGGIAPGYGELEYNLFTYGTPRPGSSTMQKFSPAWSVDNWGEDLLIMTSYDGRLLRWSPASPPGTKMIVVPGAPITNRQFVVTPEHHCILFGMGGNFADFGWCSQEDLEDWNFTSITNTAGMYTVDPYSPIVAAHVSSAGILVSTPSMTHLVDYIGLPYVYRIRPVGRVPIPISAASIVSIPEGIIWVTVEGFWMFNGTTADIIMCPIWDVVSTKMDFVRTVRESNIITMHNKGEIWWFWVDSSIDSQSVSRYIALDWRAKVWMPGYLKRTCGFTYGNDQHPIMSDGFKIWRHELGVTYPEALFMPYLESQTISVADGSRWVTVSKILPDIAGDRAALAFSLMMGNDRTQYSTQKQSVRRAVNGHGWVDIRETARDVRLRIEMVKNTDWATVGPIIFDVKPRGKKK